MRIFRSYVAVTPSPGGMERHVVELSQRQRKAGIDVIQAYSTGRLNPNLGFQVLADWPILHLRPHAVRDLLFYVATVYGVLRRRLTSEVLHVHGDWSAFLLGRFLRRALKAHVLAASVHGHLRDSFWKRPLYRLALRGYSVVYATGPREARLLAEWTGRHCHWITSGVADAFLAAQELKHARCDVLVVGSIVPVKGMELVIETARLLPERTFRIVGDGPGRSRLEAHAARAGVRNLEFAGFLPTDALAGEYRSARMLLLTSYEEGMPTAMLEAMAVGLPIVTTRSNEYGALLGRDEGGTVVDSRDAELIARVIEKYLTDEDLLVRVRRRNRMLAAQHSWDAIAGRVTQILQSALRSNAGRP